MNKFFGKYGLPLKVQFCRHCTRSNQRPHNLGEFNQKANMKKEYVAFGKKRICDACLYFFEKQRINWKKREKKLEILCDRFRKKNGEYDVIVPGSGGKDSFFVAHQLKNKYHMNPLLVTWRPALYTDIGIKNFKSWLNLGIPNVVDKRNSKTHRLLTKLAFIKLCHPFQPFIIGQKNFAPKIAVKYNIKLIMYGEGYAEFGMDKKRKRNPKMGKNYYTTKKKISDLYISGFKIEELIKKYNLKMKDLKIYLPLEEKKFEKNKLEFHNFSYYKKWNFHDNYYYAVENTDFKPNFERLEGSYDKYASMDDKLDWLHFYTFYIKFGMGRTTAATDQEIRSGVITRDEGVKLVKRFDGEFPKQYLKDCLNYMGISKKMFNQVIDKSRPKHLWLKKNGEWFLRHPIWK